MLRFTFAVVLVGIEMCSLESVAFSADKETKLTEPAPAAEKVVVAFLKACKKKDAAAVKDMFHPMDDATPEKIEAIAKGMTENFARQKTELKVQASVEKGDLACVLLIPTEGRDGKPPRTSDPTYLAKDNGKYKLLLNPPKKFRAQMADFMPWIETKFQSGQ